ncbi:FtsQ-type POTRA domain-containing protein [Haloferula sp. BvORR071]|uniref:cell division protein FtsQ/DivIB n=1 Tax=Haloferula sp. BvORR071 TaxID=1396141 RepID=UPI0005519B06|nr:FtsQ-type POTRA domain-containing protein [Haloferula sp. BvORR071]
MFKKRTTRVRHSKELTRLQVNILSPRIVWFSFLKSCRRLFKFAMMVGLGIGLFWGIRELIHRGLVDNKEFKLTAIELTPNAALDERLLIKVANIDIKGSLFQCDPDKIESILRALPEVAGASVRREFPGTLVVEVIAREPYAWVSGTDRNIPARDPDKGLVVDRLGFLFHCPEPMESKAAMLPVFQLGEGGEPLAAGKRIEHPEFERLRRLYQVACRQMPGSEAWIYALRQSRVWSLELESRDGTTATFGLGDHERQVATFKDILDHAREAGDQIASINLIPERNIPVVLRGDAPPRAILINEPGPAVVPRDRRSRDLQNLLNR